MARTITDIKGIMTDAFITDKNVISLYGLDTEKTFDQQFSKVSIENILFYVVAVVIFTIESIFDTHKLEVDNTIAELKPHTRTWYKNLAINFRFGYAIDKDTLEYSDEAKADEDAAIIKYAACDKSGTVLYLKVAGEGADGLGKLSDEEQTAFDAYLEYMMDAGVNIKRINENADYLYILADVWFNPLVLDDTGMTIKSSDYGRYPVTDAINNYLQNLTFDGQFSITALTDAIQAVEGVENVRVFQAKYKYGNYDWTEISNQYKPYAGWLKIYDPENDLKLNYHAAV